METNTDLHVFILAAGHGRRMGEVGEHLPKPLWPLFETDLLGMHLRYFQTARVASISINQFHLGDFAPGVMENRGAKVFHESELLGVGGGISNMAGAIEGDGPILVVNVDQYFHLANESVMDSIVNVAKNWPDQFDHILYATHCTPNTYNELRIEQGLLKGIVPPVTTGNSGLTYSGVCLLRADRLRSLEGSGKFFGDLLDIEKMNIGVIDLGISENDYFDFGTLDRYYHGLQKVVDSSGGESYFFKKMRDLGCIKEDKIVREHKNYHANGRGVFNFTEKFLDRPNLQRCVLLDGPGVKLQNDQVCWRDLTDNLGQ